MKADRKDVYQTVTDRIIEAIEAGTDGNGWKAPWHVDVAAGLPSNAVSKRAYRGVNVFALWAEQTLSGYTLPLWATYKQWADGGAQVRKGEKGTTVLLWKPTVRTVTDAEGNDAERKSLFARAFTVFNAAQVDGYEAPATVEVEPFETVEHAEEFFEALGADVTHGGSRAYYTPAADRIQLPPKESFVNPVAYYATSAHEHVHWTGHEKRCARDLKARFGDAQYAAEELVAELGAAYVCGILGLTNEPREDHAQYVANWLTLLKGDPKAIVTAASKAQQAVDYLVETSQAAAKVAA